MHDFESKAVGTSHACLCKLRGSAPYIDLFWLEKEKWDKPNSFPNFGKDHTTCKDKREGSVLLPPSAQADDCLQVGRDAARIACAPCAAVSVKSVYCQIAVLVIDH